MRWSTKNKPDSEVVTHLRQVLGVSEPIAGLLAQRDIRTFQQAKTFFRPSLDGLHDPFLMKDMERAVHRIEQALAQKEKILIYGDYDVDGTTSVALLYSYLRRRTTKIDCYIPDRYKEGYGISFQGIDYANGQDVGLIIALDCGIKALDQVSYAKSLNIDLIICDHHRPGNEIPEAVAVLNPKRSDCAYPFKELSGCGVGFKLVQALAQRKEENFSELVNLLDLVAAAIAADIVPVTGENRILAYHGLEVLNTLPRPGFAAVLEINQRKKVSFNDVLFIIAPRINAAGRMRHGLHAVQLLTEVSIDKAKRIAEEIEVYNKERKNTDKSITEEALKQIETNEECNRSTTVVYKENWHKGVLGIVASRLIETYYRPSIVFTKSGSKLAASARSIRGFDIYNALEQCSEHLEQFGGHQYAAGLTLQEDQYDDFKRKFEEVVSKSLPPEIKVPELRVDLELQLSEITPKFVRILNQFAPFGPGNPYPLFLSRDLIDTGGAKCVGKGLEHLRCRFVEAKSGSEEFNAIGFGLSKKQEILSQNRKVHIVYSVEENFFNGTASLQLNLKDLKTPEELEEDSLASREFMAL